MSFPGVSASSVARQPAGAHSQTGESGARVEDRAVIHAMRAMAACCAGFARSRGGGGPMERAARAIAGRDSADERVRIVGTRCWGWGERALE
jgi:hypothetical protein